MQKIREENVKEPRKENLIIGINKEGKKIKEKYKEEQRCIKRNLGIKLSNKIIIMTDEENQNRGN